MRKVEEAEEGHRIKQIAGDSPFEERYAGDVRLIEAVDTAVVGAVNPNGSVRYEEELQRAEQSDGRRTGDRPARSDPPSWTESSGP